MSPTCSQHDHVTVLALTSWLLCSVLSLSVDWSRHPLADYALRSCLPDRQSTNVTVRAADSRASMACDYNASITIYHTLKETICGEIQATTTESPSTASASSLRAAASCHPEFARQHQQTQML